MARFGFVGGTYQSDAVNADAQRTVNWYPEIVESGGGATMAAMYPTPGLKRFTQLQTAGIHSPVRGMYEYNGRCFVVADRFYELFADGSFTGYDTIPDDGLPVTMAANNVNQLMICGGSQLWLFPLVPVLTATVTSVQGVSSPPGSHRPQPAYLEVTLSAPSPYTAGSQVIYFSGLTGGAAWLNNQTMSVNSVSGNIITGRSGSWLTAAVPPFPWGPVATGGQVTTAQTGQITAGLQGTPYMVDFVDGYFVLLLKDSPLFQTSNLEDGSTWDPSFIYQTEEFSGNIISMCVHLREVWFFGSKKGLVYYDSGDPLTPFQPIPGAYIDHGCNAAWSPARLDNSIFWIGSDERGRNVAWRSQGNYSPLRVSTHGVESIWKTYSTLSDAISYTFSKCGHGFWHIWFPSANASWRYDTTTNMWHEVASLAGAGSGQQGSFIAHRTRCHVYAFEKNLVGSRALDGGVYELTGVSYDDLYDAPMDPIRRLRRAPHILNELEYQFHHRLRVYLESGLGPIPALSGPGEGRWDLELVDANSMMWSTGIQDSGVETSSLLGPAAAAPTALAPFVDLAFFPYQIVCYTLGVTTSGSWYLIPVPQPLRTYIRHLRMQTQPGFLQTAISVQFGRLVIDPPRPATREPQVMLRWSDDGGHSWSDVYTRGVGRAGEFNKIVQWQALGRSRTRCYEISVSDAIPWRIVDAYLDLSDPQGEGYKPVERYAHRIRKQV